MNRSIIGTSTLPDPGPNRRAHRGKLRREAKSPPLRHESGLRPKSPSTRSRSLNPRARAPLPFVLHPHERTPVRRGVSSVCKTCFSIMSKGQASRCVELAPALFGNGAGRLKKKITLLRTRGGSLRVTFYSESTRPVRTVVAALDSLVSGYLPKIVFYRSAAKTHLISRRVSVALSVAPGHPHGVVLLDVLRPRRRTTRNQEPPWPPSL